ncbi:hypothetical protein QFZ23_000466 [Arthrobacter globiformis]|nr:hypothetical protein [Arthrobacter globiformis]
MSGSPQGFCATTETADACRLLHSASNVPSPPSATGSSVAVPPASRMLAAMAAATSAAWYVPLKLSGATRTVMLR